VRNLQLLRDASRSTLYELADAIDELDVSAGTALVRQGEAADAFYVLVAGRVEVTVWSPDGPALLRHLVAPNYFGEIGLLHAVPRSSTVTATGPCTIWRIPAAVFLAGVAEAGVSGALSDTVQVRFSARPQSLPVDELPPCGP
jgi:CRP-like cAMP-binding protein